MARVKTDVSKEMIQMATDKCRPYVGKNLDDMMARSQSNASWRLEHENSQGVRADDDVEIPFVSASVIRVNMNYCMMRSRL